LNSPLIIGHRGASAAAPENTLAAFAEAQRVGADGIEFDVRLSRDGIPVVIHDANLKRTAGLDEFVAHLDGAALRQVNVGAFFEKSTGHYPVPLLADVFEMFRRSSAALYVEMKGEPVSFELIRAVASLVEEFKIFDQVVVESFDLQAIGKLKEVLPAVRTAALFESVLRRPTNLLANRILTAAKKVGANEIAPHHSLVTGYLIAQARNAGLPAVAWTVDRPNWIERGRALGLKALITNDPAALLRKI
jgi:glycerophosphoryl diester phosphodiesterase